MALFELLAVVELPTIGGNPLEFTHNTWAFTCTEASGNHIDVVQTALERFYNNQGDADLSVAGYLGKPLSRASNAASISYYDISGHLDGSPHGAPIAIRPFTLGFTGASASNPEGVSICLSFHSDYGADVEFGGGGARPRSRDRGRVFLGPISTLATDIDPVTFRVRVHPQAREDLAYHCSVLAASSDTEFYEWCVWSRTAAALKPVRGGWVDDRYDYQRRREDPGLTRLTWFFEPA